MIVNALRGLFRKRRPYVKAIYIADSGGDVMRALPAANVLLGKGLEGDRYATNQGYWHKVESCEVTIITEDEVAAIKHRAKDFIYEAGMHRRNLVLADISQKQLKGQTIQLGSAVLQYQKPRPPCGYINQITQTNLAKAMSYDCGACFKVITAGELSVGDEVNLR